MMQRCLPEAAERVLTDDVPSIVINRFAAITQNFCLEAYFDPDEDECAISDCPYLMNMLGFCHYRCVYDMFLELFNPRNEKAKNLWSMMARDHWVDSVVNFIRDFPKEFSGERDTQSAKLEAVLKLIPAMNAVPQFQEYLDSADVVRVIAAELKNAPMSLFEAQWEAIAAIVGTDSASGARGLSSMLDQMFEKLMNRPERGFVHYQELILRVLAAMAKIMSVVRQKIMEKGFDQFMVSIVRDYPWHTLAHHAVNEFVTETLAHEDLAAYLIKPLLELAVDWFKDDASVVARAFAWDFGNRIKDCQFIEIDRDFLQKVNDMNERVAQDYGGPVDDRRYDGGYAGCD